MKRNLLVVLIAILAAVLGYGQAAGPQRQTAPPAAPTVKAAATAPAAAAQRALLDQYCVTCHNDRAKVGGLSLESADINRVGDNAELWEKVVRKLRAGVMPPPSVKRPEAASYDALTTWIEGEIDRKAVANVNPGTKGIHRLNRAEYANAIHDLLDVEVDADNLLPQDDSSNGFDNNAGSLSLSSTLAEAYVGAAAKISRMAVGDWRSPAEASYMAPTDTTQSYQLENQTFGTRGGIEARHTFQADGEYVFWIRPLSMGAYVRDEQLELTIDGERAHLWGWDEQGEVGNSDNLNDRGLQARIPVKAGAHTVAVTFLATNYRPNLDPNRHYERTTLENARIAGFTGYPHVSMLQIRGPFNSAGSKDAPSVRKIFVCRPANASQEDSCAKEILSTLARRAYRRPQSPEDLEGLMSFYKEGRNQGTFESGIELALWRVLSSPNFLVRVEQEPANVAVGKAYRISDLELASRLSFFLWSSIPDDELLTLANQGRLRNATVLEQQVKRMLADPRSDAIVKNFAGQWLYLRNLPTTAPLQTNYPDWDDSLRQGLRTETEKFFESIMREDRNVLDLMTADYTYVNERVAKHYGIPDIYGPQFRKVTLGPEFDARRGLLGKGAILTIASNPDRTSPVKRGVWILENILGTRPPDPPPNVPALEKTEGAPGQVLTLREKMQMHRRNEPCATCHKLMDPIGFSLENFSATGKWRDKDGGDGGAVIDASGQLFDGSAITGPASLRQALLRYSPQFLRTVTEKLMTYGLGRGVEYYDMPEIRKIVKGAAAKNNRFSAIVLGIVQSPAFQMKMKVEETRVR